MGAVLAALGAAWLGNGLATPMYATSVTFFVTAPGQGVADSYTGDLLSQQRVKSYADLLSSERLAVSVAATRGLGLTPGQIAASVTAQSVPDTVLLQATVTDRDPVRGQRVCTILAHQFVDLVRTLETPPGGRTPTVKVEVVAGPSLNPIPVSPRKTRNIAIAVLLGLMVGLGAAVLRDMLDVTIKTTEALAAVAATPVLGSIPFDSTARRSPLVNAANNASIRAESFRHLRTNLQFIDAERPVRVIAITSSVPDEGKSTTAVNLATVLAEAGHRTLLVEADLRRPRVADYLGLEGAVGLSDVLAGHVDVDDVVQRWGRYGLDVLPSGFCPPNPSELLGSQNMAVLMGVLRQRYDIIVVDTPPLLPVTDGAVVAVKADGAVLVVRSGRTPQARVRQALASLVAIDVRVLGTVLTMQRNKPSARHYYYYEYRSDKARLGWLRRRPRTSPSGADRAPGAGALDLLRENAAEPDTTEPNGDGVDHGKDLSVAIDPPSAAVAPPNAAVDPPNAAMGPPNAAMGPPNAVAADRSSAGATDCAQVSVM